MSYGIHYAIGCALYIIGFTYDSVCIWLYLIWPSNRTHFLLHSDVQGGVGEISIFGTLVKWELTD
jgi:hypothetical protein